MWGCPVTSRLVLAGWCWPAGFGERVLADGFWLAGQSVVRPVITRARPSRNQVSRLRRGRHLRLRRRLGPRPRLRLRLSASSRRRGASGREDPLDHRRHEAVPAAESPARLRQRDPRAVRDGAERHGADAAAVGQRGDDLDQVVIVRRSGCGGRIRHGVVGPDEICEAAVVATPPVGPRLAGPRAVSAGPPRSRSGAEVPPALGAGHVGPLSSHTVVRRNHWAPRLPRTSPGAWIR